MSEPSCAYYCNTVDALAVSGPCTLLGVILTDASISTINVYDNADGSPDAAEKICSLGTTTATYTAVVMFPAPIPITRGIYVDVTSSIDNGAYTIIYR